MGIVVKLRILRSGDCPGLFEWNLIVTPCPYTRKPEKDLTNCKGEDNVTTEAETVVIWPQAKECKQPPGAERGNMFSPRASRESMALLTA